jgi:hypothetical protein
VDNRHLPPIVRQELPELVDECPGDLYSAGIRTPTHLVASVANSSGPLDDRPAAVACEQCINRPPGHRIGGQSPIYYLCPVKSRRRRQRIRKYALPCGGQSS